MLQTPEKPRRLGAGRLVGLLTVGLLLAAGFGAWAVFGQQRPAADETLAADLSGAEPQPMRIYASEITEWTENNEQVVLLRGKVFIQQDLVCLYLREGIVWIATETKNGATLKHLDIYGEGVDFEESKSRRKAQTARVKMTTVGLVMKIFGGNLIRHESGRGDPLFARAQSQRGPGWAQAAAPQSIAALAGQNGSAAPIPTAASSSDIVQAAFLDTPTGSGLGVPQAQPPAAQGQTQAPAPALGRPLLTPPPGAVPLGNSGPAVPSALPGASASPNGTQGPILGAPMNVPIGTESSSGVPTLLSPPAIPTQGPAPWAPLVVPVPGQVQPAAPPPLTPPPGTVPPGAAPPVSPPPGAAPPPPGAALQMQTPAAKPDAKAKAPQPVRSVSILSRTKAPWSATKEFIKETGEWVWIVPTPINILVREAGTNKVVIDIEADRLVYWSREKDTGDAAMKDMGGPSGSSSSSMEFYLSGHVEIRNQHGPKDTQTMRADECYYDVTRNVAVALNAKVELTSKATPVPIIFQSPEIEQVGKVFKAVKAIVAATQYVSDPGIYVAIDNARMEQQETPRTNFIGLPYFKMKDWSQDQTSQKVLTGNNAITYMEGVPIMYFPYIKVDPDKPLGPLAGIGVGDSTIFGFQVQTTWDMFDLLGIVPDSGKKWQLYLDESTARGPDSGWVYKDEGKNLLGNLLPGFTNKYEFNAKILGVYDTGLDDIGGSRGTSQPANPYTATNYVPINHPDFRYWTYGTLNLMDMPEGFSFMGRVSRYSDQNYLDQWFNGDWVNGPNQDTFGYLKQQSDFWYWSFMAQDRLNPWITQTNWLPKADGYVIGYDLFPWLTWHTKAGLGFAQLQVTDAPPGAYEPTDKNTTTARADWWHELSTWFPVGDAKFMPYIIGDLTYYSSDLDGAETARVYGGAGMKGSMPFARLFPDVKSDLFNLDGIYHKVTLNANYYLAYTNVHYTDLPQLDRLNDDESNQSLMNIHPLQQVLNPSNAQFLETKLFDPQFYALQRLVMTQVDTLDDINELQLSINQRWQTKRGVGGDEHVVDWMTLDAGVTIFPDASRDNFDQQLGLIYYNWLWNVGDRTALFSDGWMDPIYGGPRFFDVGATFNRPDKTTLTINYRQLDPLNSKAVIASVTYPLSAKYAITGSTMYDFGVDTQVNTIMLTRIGTDLSVSIGISYNSILNNFSLVAMVVPNLIGASKAGPMGAGGGGYGTRQ